MFGRRRFDLVVSDINMPNLDGLWLMEMISPRGMVVPTVFAAGEPPIGGLPEKRRAEVTMLRHAVAARDLDALRGIGHNLKGVGGGYGFDALTDLGRALEERARAGDCEGSSMVVEAIADYVARVVVAFADD